MSNFKDRLRELRKFKGLKQVEMAEFLEINIRTYQEYEYGKIKPSIDTLIKLADYFDVNLDYLVGRSDKREKIL